VSAPAEPRRFICAVHDEAVADLHRRIDAARWPDELDGAGWDYGTPLGFLREVANHWRHRFDWRAAEARINAFDQYQLAIDEFDTHFIHQRSAHVGATPLLMTHGWPGSIIEFLDVIPRLTQPERFGGRAEDAFHVVCPSLPGYGFSDAARVPGMSVKQVAGRHLTLMAALGYDRFVAQGGDWGSIISRWLPEIAPERLIGLHLNMLPPWKPRGIADPMALATPAERARLEADRARLPQETGYQAIQGTKPQTLAYGLTDSPVGLAGWILEKFHAWTDNRGDPRDALSLDQMLANVSLYWFTGTIASSMRLYREYQQGLTRGEIPTKRVEVPTGAALYPRDIYLSPRAWVEHQYNIVHWFTPEIGGHFAAFEQPAMFAADLLAFHARLREVA
jgi:microsomal epoxide hydrolase